MIICFLFFGAKFAAIRPMIMALSAAIIISMKIICINIMDCSITILIFIYYKYQNNLVQLVVVVFVILKIYHPLYLFINYIGFTMFICLIFNFFENLDLQFNKKLIALFFLNVLRGRILWVDQQNSTIKI